MLQIAMRAAVAAAIVLTAAAAPAANISVQPRIVNGLYTSDFPTTGQLLSGNDPTKASSWCSGTMIGCSTFLTAAHCVEDDSNPANYKVFLQHAGIFSVTSITSHPNYNFPVADVAVLKLGDSVTGIAPTPINTTGSPAFGTTGTIVGFGRSGGNNDDYGLKRYGSITTASCSLIGESNTTSVCWEFADPVGAAGTDSNTCNADSGGPLFVDFGAGDVVAGITSGGGSADCLAYDGSYDANVYNYRTWIQQQAGNDILNSSCGSMPQVGEVGADVAGVQGTLSSGSPQAVHSFQVGQGTSELRIAMNSIDDGSADFDLYVRYGSAPTTSTYDCKADGSNHLGYCEFASPTAGTWYALVRRFSGSGKYQVTTTTFGAGCVDNDPCDDGNPCTTSDVCQAGTCTGTAVANGTSCDDGNACTLTDTCQGGTCSGSGSTCGDSVVQSCEQCDDGNLIDGDGCESDCTLTPPAETHDTAIDPIKPLKVRIANGSLGVSKTIRVKVRNADLDEADGHLVTMTANDGDCPSGTIAFVDFGVGGSTNLGGGRIARGTIGIDISAGNFDSPNQRSPARCTAEVRVDAPGLDPTAANNATPLVIDVYDRNDF